jgi:Uma2 family endonuclease
VDNERLAKPDAMLLVADDLKRQAAINSKLGKKGTKYGRIRIAPTLLIESVSIGHEKHDRSLKRRWYAEFGVKNYWILDAFRKTLECLILEGGSYKLDVMGRKSEKIRPRAFRGLVISLGKIWV